VPSLSGWIKVEKDLSNDPRVLKMASRLSHADVTLGSRSRLVVVGALVTLWWYADTHIGDDDVLAIGADEVDELVGLKGFCALMPQDWLQVLDADHVKLIDYVAHNGSHAKNTALAQKRQQRHREKPTSTSRSRHAPVTQDALPDKTETRQRQDLKKKTTDRAAAQPEPGEFVELRRDFPKRAGSHRWQDALGAYRARLHEGTTPQAILSGVRRYAAFIRATGKEGTEYVQQAATFLGKNRGFELPWHPPAKPETAGERLMRTLNGDDDSRVIEHDPAFPALTGH
jgi:hypothetical protein